MNSYNPSMLRLPVTALGSSLFPRVAPLSSPHFIRHFSSPSAPPPFYPWCITTALQPYPPLFFPAYPAPFTYPGPYFGSSFRPFCSTNGLTMERPEREPEPPQKRRKSSEERPKNQSENAEERTRSYKTDTDFKDQSGRCFSPETGLGRTKAAERTRSKQDWSGGAGKQEQQKTRVDGSNPRTSAVVNDTDAQAQSKAHVKPLQRLWEFSPHSCSDSPPPPGVSVDFDFTVMSYNILSQDLLVDNDYLYRHCEPEVLLWDFRLPNLLREIQQHQADILCLQEVQENHYKQQIRPALEALGYKCVYKKRTGFKSDGCAVVYRRSRLSLLSSNPVEFYRRGDALLDRDNVGLVVRLSPTSDPAYIKLAQLAILLAELNRTSRLPDGSSNPVLLCGDLNSTPSSPLYRFLTSGRLDYRNMAIGMVSGQEQSHGGMRRLSSPLWSDSLGISSSCQYQDQDRDQEKNQEKSPEQKTEETSSNSPTAVEGGISNMTVEDLVSKTTEDILNRWKIEHHLNLRSSYNHKLNPDGRDEITTCHSRTAMTVDYILYTPDSPVGPSSSSSSSSSSLPGGRGLQLLGRLSLVGRSELEQVNGLPNHNHSSDHLPLLARFRLRR
ncbi:hypothetical protein WMY93_015273 [Mugilogobius chulae]|uniref:Endonuclease/exonuclease/phosphatase domain-containing protein n=1 Tax=Mugilogobius chulae TaxID=88201 RepID=A0AAW0P003_9GOBI